MTINHRQSKIGNWQSYDPPATTTQAGMPGWGTPVPRGGTDLIPKLHEYRKLIGLNQEESKMTLRDFYLKRAKAEFPVFLKVLRALPKDLSYKPHDRSPSAEQLVWTLTNEMKALIDVVETGKCEWGDTKPPGLDEMIQMFENWSTELLEKVAALDDASQERNAQFLYQGKVVMERPTVEFLWDFMFDAIHHRGQLSAYIRPMGGKVPSIYGPSADDSGM